MPLDSAYTLRISSIPSNIKRQDYADFVRSLRIAPPALPAQKNGKSSHWNPLKWSGKKKKTDLSRIDDAELPSSLLAREAQISDENDGLEPSTTAAGLTSPPQAIDDIPNGSIEVKHASLASKHGSKLGTVSFTSKETLQQALKRHEKGKTDHGYRWKDLDLSRNFQGVTVLYEYNEGKGVEVDICAVHGLGGNAMDTWTADNGDMWLRDYLPSSEYFTKSRIMTFGYDSDLTDKKTVMTLENWAQTLLGNLNEAMPEIPVSSIRGIELSRCGLVFLATPHSGATQADWNDFVVAAAGVVAGVRQEVVSRLKAFNPKTVWDKRAFLNLDPRPPFRCFAEGRKMDIKGLGAKLVVEQDSAALDPKTPAYRIQNTDHKTICKFNRKDGPYVTINLALEEVCLELDEKLTTDTEQSLRIFGHPRFVAHAYPPHKGAWWEGSEMNEVQYRLALDTPLVGRTEEMAQLHGATNQSSEKPKLTVIKGIAGIGKTELLMRFAMSQRSHRNIFFLRARNSKSLENALADVCNSIGFDMIENPNINWERWLRSPVAERIQIFLSWLGKDFNKDSLLILDDAEVFGAASIQAALKYPAWHVVMSTRDSNLRGGKRKCRDLPLSPLTSDATALILKDTMQDLDRDVSRRFSGRDIRSLAQAVHGHPLAAQNVIPFLLRYLINVENPTKDFIRILNRGSLGEKKVFFNFKEKDRSLWDAFNSSLQLLKRQEDSENAVRLLQLLPYLRTDDDCIDSFLQITKKEPTTLFNASEDAIVLRSEYLVVSEWLNKLQDVSFYITTGPTRPKSLQIHPLVLQFAQLIASEDAQKRRIRELLKMFYELGRNDYHQIIIPHAEHCLEICIQLGTTPQDLGLPSEVELWLSNFHTLPIQPAGARSSSQRIENPFCSAGEKKSNDFIRLCEEAKECFQRLNPEDGYGQAGPVMSKCAASFKELKGLADTSGYQEFENLTPLEDAVRSFYGMASKTSIYPDLLAEMNQFRKNLGRQPDRKGVWMLELD
ncbi:hypothetical protein FALBO_10506 [Fusarium albosuccineum]|uniref:Uncharacterized protein n=1 Tax=Fusarium albosuccineum TaxID=1237068 RepID=A0A8H4L6V9_9HYPO|nr:hypothetical protein FALBO_10506 [Fusarium albosuccineum]